MSYKLRRPLTVSERNRFSFSSDLLAHLLFHRGVESSVDAERFLAPDYSLVHDPFLLKDAEKAGQRIIQAIKNDERIAVYADYDADGIPAAAIFNDLFSRIGFKNFRIYIPHRHDEGFGLNSEAVQELFADKVKLIITLDCGITDVNPIEEAKKLGMDVIVTDHHEPPLFEEGKSHPAFAVVDHKQPECKYPDKNLCGSGVGFKLIQAILKIDRLGLKDGAEKWLLDLVGIATLSDMVPLVGENRIFAHYGLAVLRKSPRKGLVKLFESLKMDQKNLTEDDIVFMVTPRINAASRMGVATDAFHLLSADTAERAAEYVALLDKVNNERKGIVSSLVKEVKKIIRERHIEGFLPSVLVLGNPDWRPSLLGLVANSCAEEFDRPVFLWGRDGDNVIKGSCRSEGRTSVVELMRRVPSNVFLQFGGHHQSGGFAVMNEGVHYLEKHLSEAGDSLKKEAASAALGENDIPLGTHLVDAELKLDDVTEDLFKDINRMAPFGMSNPKPLFIFKGVTPNSVRKFGKAQDHVEIVFKRSNGTKLPAIAFFGVGEKWFDNISTSKKFDLLASVELSTFRGRKELRLRVVDVI